MDSMQLHINSLEVDNLKLRCDLGQLQEELALVEQDRAHLKEELEAQQVLYQQLVEGTQEAEAEQPATSRSQEEASQLRETLDSVSTSLSEEKARAEQMERTLESKTRSLEEEKTRAGELEEQLRRLSREMEYARCCAVLKEAQKWEAREARLVRQLEESERRLLIDRAHATRQPTLLATEPLLHDVSGDASALSVTSPPRRNAVTSVRPPSVMPESDMSVACSNVCHVLSSQAPPFVPATQLHATGVRDVPNPTTGVSDVLNPTWSTTGVRDVPNPTTGVSDVLNPTWSTTGVRDVPNPTTGVSDVLNPTWSTTGVRPPVATTGAGVRLPLSSTSTTVAPGSTWTGMSRRPDEALYSSQMPDVSGVPKVVPSPNVGPALTVKNGVYC